MAAEKPDTAVLDVESVDGRLPVDLKARFYDVVFASLDKTGKFHLLPKDETPHLPHVPPSEEVGAWQDALGSRGLSHAFIVRCEEAVNRLTGQPCWKFTFLLYDLKAGRRLALKEHFLGKEAPADDLKWALYEFADADRFAELAREHRLADLAKDPAKAGSDPQFLTTLLLAALQKADWDTALDAADRILSAEPRSALALHAKGLALFRRGRLQEAQDAVEASLRVRPNSEGFILRGDLNLSAGREDVARESYLEASRLDPDGARAQAKLSSLDRFHGPDRDPLQAFRLGWMWGYLQYVGVMTPDALSEGLSRNALAVGAELERQYRELAGVHPARLVGPEHWNAWVRSLGGADAKGFKEATDQFFGRREAVSSVEDCLPPAVRQWVRSARELFWVQAVFYSLVQRPDEEPARAPENEIKAFGDHATSLARDPVLDVTLPELAALARRMETASKTEFNRERMDEAVDLIERFRRRIFEESEQKAPPQP